MGGAVQWSLMKPESWSGWFPLKSSPTCSYRWLHCDFQKVPREHPNCTVRTLLADWSVSSKSKLLYDWQSVSMSWYRVPLWDLRPNIISCRNVAVWNFRSCIYLAPSLTRGRVCNLQCNHSIVLVAQNPKPYFTVSSETPPTWRARFPYLYPPGTGWLSYTPDTGFPLRCLLRLASYDSQGYGGGILIDSPTWGDRSLYMSSC
jgi:hypothetical protein